MGSKSVSLGAEETGRSGRTESSAPTGAAENRGLYRTRKMVPDRHHQDRVRRVVGLREVTRGGQIRPDARRVRQQPA